MRIILILFLIVTGFLHSQNTNISNGPVFDGEPFLAINPNNPHHMVVAWMTWVNFNDQFKIKAKATFDAGETWSAAQELPHIMPNYTSADPCVDFNNQGEVFVSYIDFTGTNPPVTGGVYLCKSTDGGLSWGAPTEVISTSYDGSKWPIDRPWMVIDKSNSSNEGNIYITTFNLNRTNPSFNPYLSTSHDSGNTFSQRYIDANSWLAGSINPLPMCSPAVSSSGTFHGSYPSYVISQNPYAQTFLASSNDGGATMSYQHMITFNPPSNLGPYSLAKKGSLLLCNPADSNHLCMIHLSAVTGDLDVYMIESFDEGANWTSPLRVNDDPIANDRMQDMLWGDFDSDGDLIISWRDRRNGSDSTFQTETEIWAAFRNKDSVNFASNFQITNATAAHDTALEAAGNDFMCIKLQDDTLNAVWGDVRTGKLNIWFQRMNTKGVILSTKEIAHNNLPRFYLYPNPSNTLLHIEGQDIEKYEIYDLSGKVLLQESFRFRQKTIDINVLDLTTGKYLIRLHTPEGIFTDKFIKQ